jgi:Fe-Mn family superoxide dismutase
MSSTLQHLMTRRRVTKAVVAAATTTTIASRNPLVGRVTAYEPNLVPRLQGTATPDGPFVLDPLPYDFAALEPHIDAMTMEIHHDRHHQAYVDNLNKAISDLPELQAMTVEELIQNLDMVPEEKRAAVRNNAGGHFNHAAFWDIMTPGGSSEPTGALAEAIASEFGDLAALQDAISTAGLGQFGSGWAWLVVDESGKLAVMKTPNQDNPGMEGTYALILNVDVWEHAYYLKYQNKRKDYLDAWWNLVNWDIANSRYEVAMAFLG